MATLVHHNKGGQQVKTHGTVENLQSLMVTSLKSATKFRPADLDRYVKSSVKAAIRRQGITDAGDELIMSAEERANWERENPLP